MKQTFAILSILFGCSRIAGQASAAEIASLAYVNQASAGGFARMDRASIMAPIMQVARDMPRVDSGNSGLAWCGRKAISTRRPSNSLAVAMWA